MKNFYRILLAAVVAFGCSMSAKADNPIEMKRFFDECSKNNNFETVMVNKELLKLADNANFGIMGVKEILGKIETIGIATTDEKKFVPILTSIADKYFSASDNGNYDVLLTSNEDNEQTKILVSRNKTDNKNTFVIITREPSEMTVVVIYGTLSMNDIKKLKL